ncbi:MAG: T9SS type A sorting domain-containing protein, partial [Bacteroidota bacterium]
LNVVFVAGGLTGDPFAISFDEIVFDVTNTILGGGIFFDDFNDGNVDNTGAFAGGADNTGAGTGPTDGSSGDPDTGLNLGVDPGTGGGFAGAFITFPGGTFDATGAGYFFASVRPSLQASNLPFVLEITLQEDPGGDGFDPAVDDELRTFYSLDLNADWREVQIPLATFQDSPAGLNDGFDFSSILNVVFVAGGLTGDPFAISFDDILFTSSTPVSNEEFVPGTVDGFALSAAYPNPFQTSARVELSLDRAEAVRVEVYDVLGRQVALLHDGTLAAQTPHSFTLNARGLASGLYLYRVTGESFSATRRVILN